VFQHMQHRAQHRAVPRFLSTSLQFLVEFGFITKLTNG
jgi:hypothetical protein